MPRVPQENRRQTWRRSLPRDTPAPNEGEREESIERITGIDASKKSHVLLYGANVGDHCSPLQYAQTATALFPHRYPAQDTPIDLATINGAFIDRDGEFWTVEATSLRRRFEQRIGDRITTGDID